MAYIDALYDIAAALGEELEIEAVSESIQGMEKIEEETANCE